METNDHYVSTMCQKAAHLCLNKYIYMFVNNYAVLNSVQLVWSFFCCYESIVLWKMLCFKWQDIQISRSGKMYPPPSPTTPLLRLTTFDEFRSPHVNYPASIYLGGGGEGGSFLPYSSYSPLNVTSSTEILHPKSCVHHRGHTHSQMKLFRYP